MRMKLRFGSGYVEPSMGVPLATTVGMTEADAWAQMDREVNAACNVLAIKNRIELEERVRAFIERTGLPENQVVIVRFPSGVFEPQWRGILPPQQMFSSEPCPECGREH